MRRFSQFLALAGLIITGACADQATAPASMPDTDSAPLFAKGSGGNGSPHFTADGTECTFNSASGRLACDWQIAGLSSYSNGAGVLAGNVMISWECLYTDASRNYSREQRRVVLDFLYYSDKSGNAKGSVESTPLGAFCLPKYIGGAFQTPSPSNVQFALDPASSPFTLPGLGMDGAWALYAGVTTPKGGVRYIFYMGSWMPEV